MSDTGAQQKGANAWHADPEKVEAKICLAGQGKDADVARSERDDRFGSEQLTLAQA